MRDWWQPFKQAAFGHESEKTDPDQFDLALEDLETAMAAIHAEDEADSPAGNRINKPRATNRGSLPQHLPRVEEIIDVLIGNGDMHLKNWSLTYPDRRHARLSSAYDFVSTIPYIGNDRSALTFSRFKEFSGSTFDELLHRTAKATLPRKLVVDTAKETVSLFMERWGSEKAHLPMHKEVTSTIDNHLATLPIVAGHE